MMKRQWLCVLSVFLIAGLTGCASISNVLKINRKAKESEQRKDFVECYEANLSRVKVTGTVKKVNFEECLDYARSKSHAEEKLILETMTQLAMTEEKMDGASEKAQEPLNVPRLNPAADNGSIDAGFSVIPTSSGKSIATTFPYAEGNTKKHTKSSIPIPSWKGRKRKNDQGKVAVQARLVNARFMQSNDVAVNPWPAINQGFKLAPHLEKPRVRALLRSHSNRPSRLARLSRKAAPFLPLILKEVIDRDMPTEIALLPFVESGFSTTALSHANAAGLWQFIPATGKSYGLKQTKDYDGRLNIKNSTQAALNYLSDLHKRFDGDWLLALAAYNAGEGRVAEAVAKQLTKGGKADFWSLKLPTETMLYVPRLLAFRELMSKPKQYGFVRATPSHETALSSIRVDRPIDLQKISVGARLPSRDSLVNYNPSFLNGKVNPSYEREILVPKQYMGRVKSAVRMLSI